MGVQGLLPLLKSIQKQSDLSKHKGKTLGVDAYGWLHKGAIGCASELAQGIPTKKFVTYAMNQVKMLKHFGVEPYLVFDGDFLPSKASTEAARAESRDKHQKQGMDLLRAGKKSLAFAEFQKAIDVTPEMARAVMEELKAIRVPYVVAPYEADAQLVYLERNGHIDGILSEDSDMLVFGAKLLLTKLDKFGRCVEIHRRDFCAVREVSLTGWTDDDFRNMAIMSGCDYLDGIRGTGLKTAHRYLRKYKTPEKVVQRLRFEGKTFVSEDYLAKFHQAKLTFIHQRVFCPDQKELVLLTEDPTNTVHEFPFIGAKVETSLAQAIAVGDVNPITKQPIVFARQQAPTRTATKRARAPSGPAGLPPAFFDSARGVLNQPRPAANSNGPRTGTDRARPGGGGDDPIDPYFKKCDRFPLKAMAPNSFPVDPQAVAHLTHNGLVPRVFPLPRPYIDDEPRLALAPPRRPERTFSVFQEPSLRRRSELSRSLAEFAFGSNTANNASRRQTVEPIVSVLPAEPTLPTTPRATEPKSTSAAHSSDRAAKRARLFRETNDTEEAGSSTMEWSERSRFFPVSASTLPDHVDNTDDGDEKQGPDTKTEELLRSDDSIEEALRTLPDWHGFKAPTIKTKKSIAIFEDDSQETPTTQEESQTSAGSSTADTQDTEADLMPPPPRPTETPTRVSLVDFFYRGTESGGSSSAYSTPASTTSTSSTRNSALFTPSLVASTAGNTPATGSSLGSLRTPLQSIGARALRRGSFGSPLRPAHERVRRAASNGALSGVPVNPAFVPLPRVDLAEVEALTMTGGSEDQLPIIDADVENESDGKVVGLSARLDLSRFLHG